MNRIDLIRIISDSYPFDLVSFDEEFPNDAFCIRKNENNYWEVYYSENRNKSNLKEYITESEAIIDLLNRLNQTK
ncbi:MAG: hypothetical protein CMP48_10340 [Rickettsiales bacterium]|nr:hypothetical protein [Rickettsiales bacterium]